MKITIEIDTVQDRSCSKDDYRAAAALLLHLVGDLDSEEAPAPKVPAAPSNATAPVIVSNAAQVVANVPPPPSTVAAATVFSPPPPPPVPVGTNSDEGEDAEGGTSNVLPFPVPPPPPIANTAAPIPPAPVAPTVAGASTAVSALNQTTPQGAFGFDSAGMPYDARIHQKTGNKKKDGTWKLIKGIDAAIVAAVTAELASRKGAVAPVSLPYAPSDPNRGANTVPVPPIPHGAGAGYVPAPPVTASVPIPPVTPVGPVGSFRELIEKITAATKANQITPQDVSRLCQHRGAPNLMQLNAMPELLPRVTADINAVLGGLSVDAVIAGLG